MPYIAQASLQLCCLGNVMSILIVLNLHHMTESKGLEHYHSRNSKTEAQQTNTRDARETAAL